MVIKRKPAKKKKTRAPYLVGDRGPEMFMPGAPKDSEQVLDGTLAERLVREAESYVGTPFLHQGRLKGRGVDCANFVANVARDAGVPDVEIPNNYKPEEDGTMMMRLLSRHLDFVPTSERQAGDVLALCDEALRNPEIPRHLAFVQKVTPTTTFIVHASERGVVSHRINLRWLSRIHSCWRLRA